MNRHIPSQQVNTTIIPDSNLEEVIRKAIDKPTGLPTADDLRKITSLEAEDREIKELIGLEHCVNLQELFLDRNQIEDISPLVKLSNLIELSLDENQIVDISPLSKLEKLRVLWLGGNFIADISPLSKLSNLQMLHLYDNPITDISPLAKLKNLEYLYLGDNQSVSLSPLSNLKKLQLLRMGEEEATIDTSISRKVISMECDNCGMAFDIELHPHKQKIICESCVGTLRKKIKPLQLKLQLQSNKTRTQIMAIRKIREYATPNKTKITIKNAPEGHAAVSSSRVDFETGYLNINKTVRREDYGTEVNLKIELQKDLGEKELRELADVVVKPLIHILSNEENYNEKNYKICCEAAQTLGLLRDESAVKPILQAMPQVQEYYVNGYSYVESTYEAIESLGSIACAPLCQALNDKNRLIREYAAVLLGSSSVGTKEAVEPLIQALLTETNGKIRSSIVGSLGALGDERAIEPLLHTLTADRNKKVRYHATLALGKFRSEEIVEPLIDALSDSDEEKRAGAARALGEIGDKRAVEPLKRLLSDESFTVVEEARDALESLGIQKSVIKTFEKRLEEMEDEAWEELEIDEPEFHVEIVEISDQNLEAVIRKTINKPTDPITDKDLGVFSSTDVHVSDEDIFLWIRALASDNNHIRYAATWAVRALLKDGNLESHIPPEVKEPDIIELLLQIFNDIVVDERRHYDYDVVAILLGAIKEPKAIEPLIQIIQALDEDEPDYSLEAVDAIARIGTDAKTALIQSLKSCDRILQEKIVRALAECGNIELSQIIQSDLNLCQD